MVVLLDVLFGRARTQLGPSKELKQEDKMYEPEIPRTLCILHNDLLEGFLRENSTCGNWTNRK